MMAKKIKLMYSGKTKQIFATEDEDLRIIAYTDDAQGRDGEKKNVNGKGVVNNKLTNILMRVLESEGIPTHYVEELNERETLIQAVEILPLKVIVRNVAAGSIAERMGIEEGRKLKRSVLEICYKNDALGDPLINSYHILAFDLATEDELDTIKYYTHKINEILTEFFKEINIDLVDFELEFGRLWNGQIVLTDEISPDTCRLWDAETGERLDSDRYIRNLGGAEEAYTEVLSRVLQAC